MPPESTSNARTDNNVVRHEYRVLTEAEKLQMQAVKDKSRELIEFLGSVGTSREISIATTRIEEACMWAVKHITR